MDSDLQQVIDAIARAKQTPDPVTSLVAGTPTQDIITVMARQTSATNAAVLAWLEYQVSKEQQGE